MLRRHRNLIAIALMTLTTPALLGATDPYAQTQYAQVIIHERVVIRVPRAAPPPATPIRWKERKGPRCIPAQQLAGALPAEEGAVDIVLTGGKRVRARLIRACRQIDYYSSFYIRPGPDGQICVGRDPIRTRAGRTCEIERFRSLVPVR
ncbi:hypothetical protein KV697_15260 [Sphingomonas sanguinis]|uniref:hypothetical protein n=1 Tax=Sphingomonas sanguinis TaxID=33051 RepID=UPI001C5A1C2A|nr:hypothetical protein [Sphingomonas sanguinis]QXT35116.1 hypothetical protein KV697_15260 [Sphingomonas sanguinis]